jgi:general nucleoside transport system permease protein
MMVDIIFSDLTIIIYNTILYATPLIFASIGGTFSERSGVVNIGLEGMMVIGAMSGWFFSFYFSNAWLGFLMAGVAGGMLASLHAIASVSFKANQVISGFAINLLGPGISFLIYDRAKLFIKDYLVFQFERIEIPILRDLPILGESIFSNDATQYLAIALAILSSIFIYKTNWGLRLRAVGEQPKAVDTLGINVYRIRYLAVITSGVFAGLGGASLSIAVQSEFSTTVVVGQGFIALAAMIFGKWRPIGAMFACLFFGFLQGGLNSWLQTRIIPIFGDNIIVDILAYIRPILPYALTILALIIFVGKAVAPAASGTPYEKGER